MKANRTTSIERIQVTGRFESLRQTLRLDRYAGHRHKPLAYWALPSDRRLPLALLGRTLGDLLDLPFAEITATPGIGRKKIDSFVRLLTRAVDTDPEDLNLHPLGAGDGQDDDPWAGADPRAASANGFDAAQVSEVVWARWRAAVVKQGWEDEPLGRLAPSLRNLNRMSWSIPLGRYTHNTLAEIHVMKTHGHKRIATILEVFHEVQKYASGGPSATHLAVRIRPARIEAVERWIGRMLGLAAAPGDQEVLDRLLAPLIDQLHVDAAPQIVALAENRLGLGGPITSVREAARTMGLTRARVYQLLGEMHDILAVRWPLGRALLRGLCDHLVAVAEPGSRAGGLERLRRVVELFYPAASGGNGPPLAERQPDADAVSEPSRNNLFHSHVGHSERSEESPAISGPDPSLRSG